MSDGKIERTELVLKEQKWYGNSVGTKNGVLDNMQEDDPTRKCTGGVLLPREIVLLWQILLNTKAV